MKTYIITLKNIIDPEDLPEDMTLRREFFKNTQRVYMNAVEKQIRAFASNNGLKGEIEGIRRLEMTSILFIDCSDAFIKALQSAAIPEIENISENKKISIKHIID